MSAPPSPPPSDEDLATLQAYVDQLGDEPHTEFFNFFGSLAPLNRLSAGEPAAGPPEGVEEGTPEGAPQTPPDGIPEERPEAVPDAVPEGLPEDLPESVPDDIPQGPSGEHSEENSPDLAVHRISTWTGDRQVRHHHDTLSTEVS